MKLGLQGVSIIYASGDSGVGCADTNGTQFAPFFPATCPYVTSVGATQVNQGAAITDVESAASDPINEFYSGGGFSNRFAAPSYQSSALATFFAGHKPPYASSVYNASGRGFPDVSALGQNIINISGGQQILQAGTSASAPIFASIITLINEQRLAAGKKPAGFLNPTLYANPSAFTDVRPLHTHVLDFFFFECCKAFNTLSYSKCSLVLILLRS
jgi:tripeptidyl-peptidase-1